MENAVDALKMAFAVFIFVMAITVSVMVMGQAREVSETVFYMSDKTNFYEYTSEDEKRLPQGRIVSGETIVPTLYRYYKENFNVIILDAKGNKVCVFNLEEEIKKYNLNYKNAPWLGNANVDTKKRVDTELDGVSRNINGVTYYAQKNSGSGGLLRYFKGDNNEPRKFKETFLEQRYSGKQITSEDNESIEVVKGNSKIWIVYQEYTEEA